MSHFKKRSSDSEQTIEGITESIRKGDIFIYVAAGKPEGDEQNLYLKSCLGTEDSVIKFLEFVLDEFKANRVGQN